MALTAKMVASEILVCGIKAGVRQLPFGDLAIQVVEGLQKRHEAQGNAAQVAEFDAKLSRVEREMRNTVEKEIQKILANLCRAAVPGPELTREMNELRQIHEQGWVPNLFEGLLRNSTHREELKRSPKTFGRILANHEPLDPDSLHMIIDKDTTRILQMPTSSLAFLLGNQKVGIPAAEVRSVQDIWAFPAETVAIARIASSFVNSIGMTMKQIPAGSFYMGSTEEADEMPRHLVTISQPFFLGIYPVTQAEYSVFMYANPSDNVGVGSRPVDSTLWFDAIRFCNDLSVAEGRAPFYQVHKDHVEVIDWTCSGYRLPTEAEWEYACRAGSETRFSFGDDEKKLGDYAWYSENSGSRSHPVGEKQPNRWGLFDMQGNVWEWCWDWYGESYYSNSSKTDPRGPIDPNLEAPWNQKRRVMRGGCFEVDAISCRSSARCSFWPMYKNNDPGFRVAAYR